MWLQVEWDRREGRKGVSGAEPEEPYVGPGVHHAGAEQRGGEPEGQVCICAGSCLEVHWNMVILEAGRQGGRVRLPKSGPVSADRVWVMQPSYHHSPLP